MFTCCLLVHDMDEHFVRMQEKLLRELVPAALRQGTLKRVN